MNNLNNPYIPEKFPPYSHPTREHKRFNHVWRMMLYRCENINSPLYPRYGGRGIKVCSEWQSYRQFYLDMWPRPHEKASIERIDNNGDYSPKNCRWATQKEQANNTVIQEKNTIRNSAFHHLMKIL